MTDLEQKAHEQKINSIGRSLKVINEKLGIINNKLNTVDSKLNTIYSSLGNSGQVQAVLQNVPNIIPNITGQQILNMISMGWNVDQISYISGYSYDKISDLYRKARGIRK